MESVFGAENLIVWPDARLPDDLQGAPRDFLTRAGLPKDRPDAVFDLEDAPLTDAARSESLSRCANLRIFSAYRGVRMPDGWENWLVIGAIIDDYVALDPRSGMVHSLPYSEYRAEPLNSDIESFASFLCVLESQRLAWDPCISKEPIDPRSAVMALRETLKQIDPLPFEGHEPGWSKDFVWDNGGSRMPTWDFLFWQIYDDY